MARSTETPWETIPLHALERICEYLDDNSEKRQSLWAFSLSSRACYAAAAHQRLCQVSLKIRDPGELESGLRRWAEVLNSNGGHRHVRRLKILWVMPDAQRRRGTQTQYEESEVDKDEYDYDWDGRHSFATHEFCRPSKACREYSGGKGHPEAWLPLARFVSQLPGLQDLVWAYGTHMPRSVLSAIHGVGCRLHMHYFRLGSLIQYRDCLQPINPDDYALATSPSLYSIVVRCNMIETDGQLNYNDAAVMCMVSRVAPNLAHVWMVPSMAGDSLPLREGVRLGVPSWSGFFLETTKADKQLVLGSLQSLYLAACERDLIGKWSRLTDFSCLHSLTIPWYLEYIVALADMAVRGDLESLATLSLGEIDDEADQSQDALRRLLANLKPLRRLYIVGYISNETFEVVLRRHGGNLRDLSVRPYRDRESQNLLVDFSEAVVQQLAEQCPKMETIRLWINRTRGDDREVGIYRALSRLPRLRRAFLSLQYLVGPDDELWDEEIDGEYPMPCSASGEEIPYPYLREAFSNSAIDDTLALLIFNLISAGGSLRHLRLEPRRKMGRYAPMCLATPFEDVLGWLTRSWVCKRDIQGRVTVCELDRKARAYAEGEWEYLSGDGEDFCHGEEIYRKLFNDIWPQRTSEWWNDWKSLPLT